jgi:hypothetical protein
MKNPENYLENLAKAFLPLKKTYEFPEPKIYEINNHQIALGKIKDFYIFGFENNFEWNFQIFEDVDEIKNFFFFMNGLDNRMLKFLLEEIDRLETEL